MAIGSVPPVFGRRSTPSLKSRMSDEIDFEIFGQEMQYVEIELDPGESAIAEAGAMMFKSPHIEMDTIFGDGSKPQTGMFGSLASAGKRLLTGESLFMTVFSHQG
ncbi:MAG: AIM24 family protein, partial [Pseudomonadota bacterium]